MNTSTAFADRVPGFEMEIDPQGSEGISTAGRLLVANPYGLALLRPLGWRIDPLSANWHVVHAEVQRLLEAQARRISGAYPHVQWRAGRSEAKAFWLFSYVTYDPVDGSDLDPVVVGVVVAERGGTIHITGDISGEESGYIFFEAQVESVPSGRGDLIVPAAVRVGSSLASRDRVVMDAIRR